MASGVACVVPSVPDASLTGGCDRMRAKRGLRTPPTPGHKQRARQRSGRMGHHRAPKLLATHAIATTRSSALRYEACPAAAVARGCAGCRRVVAHLACPFAPSSKCLRPSRCEAVLVAQRTQQNGLCRRYMHPKPRRSRARRRLQPGLRTRRRTGEKQGRVARTPRLER